MSKEQPSDLDYFIAGLPPSILFEMDIDNVKELVTSSKDASGRLNSIAELGLIGLAAYFEAFCKNQFAAIINICPETLRNFAIRRRHTNLSLEDILKISDTIDHRLGSLLSEQYDFGSAKNVNSLFFDLLGITPFSKVEAKKYEEFLNDRNLLVHHGGVYTFKYEGQKFARKRIRSMAHWDSLIVGRKEFLKWAEFLEKIAAKVITASYKSLEEFISREKIQLTEGKEGALKYLAYIDSKTQVS